MAVASAFLGRHTFRTMLIRRILGWPDLRDGEQLRTFVRTHPFVALRPAQTE